MIEVAKGKKCELYYQEYFLLKRSERPKRVWLRHRSFNHSVTEVVTKRSSAKLGYIEFSSRFCLVSQPAALCCQRTLMAFFRPAVIFQQLNCMG